MTAPAAAAAVLAGDLDEPSCRVCGCTENEACPGGCYWVPDPALLGDLCSECAGSLVSARPLPGVAAPASPYQVGVSVQDDHPEWRYLRHQSEPVRPASDAEAAVYAERYGHPDWADLYPPAPLPITSPGDGTPAP